MIVGEQPLGGEPGSFNIFIYTGRNGSPLESGICSASDLAAHPDKVTAAMSAIIILLTWISPRRSKYQRAESPVVSFFGVGGSNFLFHS